MHQSSIVTSENLTEPSLLSTLGKWISSLPDSRVSHSLSLVRSSAKTMPEISGQQQGTALASYNRDLHSWKTYQVSLLTNTQGEYSGSWPKSGMIVNGTLRVLPEWVPLISGKESGYWRTPDAGRGGTISAEMSNYVAENKMTRPSGTRHTLRLQDQVRNPRLWPTPSVCGNYNRKGASLTSGDGLATVAGGALNPTWVEWLMGWPIGWTGLEPVEMVGFSMWLRQFSDITQKTEGGE